MTWDEFNKIPHLLIDYIEKWAKTKPDQIAIIDADEGRWITWNQLKNIIDVIAIELMERGMQKGDIVVTMLPLLPEHIFLSYACFKLGLIFCPLDVRLKEEETVRCVQLLKSARRIIYIAPDDTDSEDKWGNKKFYAFKQIAHAVRKKVPEVYHFIQFGPEEDAEDGVEGVLNFTKKARAHYLEFKKESKIWEQKIAQLEKMKNLIDPFKDGAMIIYTTGSTGFPKPAVLSNAGIICQNMCMVKGFNVTENDRMLVNLPPSHVGCQTEQFLTTIFVGGISVILHAFKAEKTMQAIEQYKVTIFGQIPSLFVMEWRLKRKFGAQKDFEEYDTSSLRFALYGGQAVSREFLDRLRKMAPNYGSGLGLTELSGLTSYIMVDSNTDPEVILSSLGHDFPITPLSIREPMKEDGYAGPEKKTGEIGEICYSGPQVFLGYYGNEEATRKTISKDGFCYTGDLGFKDEKGMLHLAGRAKFVIKPKGYQVYPPEVEEYIQKLPEVALAGVIGVRHEVFTEGVVAFVELKRNKKLTVKQLEEHCKGLAAYKRPSLFIIVDEIPLNRVDKTDYQELKKLVVPYIEKEKAAGRWDSERK